MSKRRQHQPECMAKAGVRKWMEFYNQKRPYSVLSGKPPTVVYWLTKDETQLDQGGQGVA